MSDRDNCFLSDKDRNMYIKYLLDNSKLSKDFINSLSDSELISKISEIQNKF